MRMDVVPSEVADVVREALEKIPDLRGSVQNSACDKFPHFAIIHSKCVRSSSLREVEAQYLLFTFREPIELLCDEPANTPSMESAAKNSDEVPRRI